MLGYSVQGTLLAKYARSLDPLSVSMYRTLSFVVTLSPLLFFANGEEIVHVLRFWPQILGSAFLGAVASWAFLQSITFIPVGVQVALTTGTRTLLIIVGGMIFFREYLSLWEFLFILLILGGGAFLTLKRNQFEHLDKKAHRGIILAIIAGFLATGMILLLAQVSREANPFAAGYFWEISIGILSFFLGLLRWAGNGIPLQKISLPDFQKIALASWPTLLGTGGMTLAISMGEVGIVSAIGAAGILVTTLLCHFLYHEKLSPWQWVALFIVAVGIAGLKLAGA